MGLKKNQTNNPNGRPKGVENKTTTEIKNLLIQVVSNNIENLEKDLQKLEPKDRLFFIEKILKLILPTPTASIDVEVKEVTGYRFADGTIMEAN